MSGSGISWAICRSAFCSRQITTPAPHHSVFLQAGCPSCRPTNAVDTTSISKTTWSVVLACHSCVKWTVVPAVIDARSVTVRWHAVVQGTSSVARMDHNRWRISWISPLLPCTYCILRCQSLTVCVCLANVKCLFWGCWVFIEKACKKRACSRVKSSEYSDGTKGKLKNRTCICKNMSWQSRKHTKKKTTIVKELHLNLKLQTGSWKLSSLEQPIWIAFDWSEQTVDWGQWVDTN